jgi:ribonuclease-3
LRASDLAARLGLSFHDPSLLEQALTHSSYVNEHPEAPPLGNERLEFLGDAVLSLIISEAVWDRHPDEHEGQLTTRRAAIVSARGLAALATRIDLGSYVVLGQGAARSHEDARDSVLASAFEAVVAAVHLDLGFEAARDLVLSIAQPELEATGEPADLKAPKSRLQEYAYRISGRPPTYRIVNVEGPDHDRRYVVGVAVGGRALARGEGRNRRDAETAAASAALAQLVEPVGNPALPAALE